MVDFGVWAAPGGRDTFQKDWGFRPIFLEGFPAARGRPDPQTRRFRVGPKSYIKNLRVCFSVRPELVDLWGPGGIGGPRYLGAPPSRGRRGTQNDELCLGKLHRISSICDRGGPGRPGNALTAARGQPDSPNGRVLCEAPRCATLRRCHKKPCCISLAIYFGVSAISDLVHSLR